MALAREYGFSSWPKLKLEVERRKILDARDLERLTALISEDPALATSSMDNWRDHPIGASPLGYVTMLRFDTTHNSGAMSKEPGEWPVH